MNTLSTQITPAKSLMYSVGSKSEEAIEMERILLATDGSQYAGSTFKIAKEFLEAWPKSKLYIVFVKSFIADSPFDTLAETVRKEQTARADALRIRVCAEFNQNQIEFIVEEGTPENKICEIAKKKQVDLVILGNHGKGSFGSVSHAVAHKSNIPVLIAKDLHVEQGEKTAQDTDKSDPPVFPPLF